MLGDMLGATDITFSTPESPFFHEFLFGVFLNKYPDNKSAVKWLINNFRFSTWEMDVSCLELESLIDVKDPLKSITNILSLYLNDKNITGENRIWIDHTPDNTMNYPLLSTAFPSAKFIHIIRDGRAVANSLLPLKWGPSNYFLASKYWSDKVYQGLMMELCAKENCIQVKYEDLVIETEDTLKLICEFIGIQYEDRMVCGGGVLLPGAFSEKQHSLVGKKPRASRVDAWKQSMSRNNLNAFHSYEKSVDILKRYGYEIQPYECISNAKKVMFYLSDTLISIRNKYLQDIHTEKYLDSYSRKNPMHK